MTALNNVEKREGLSNISAVANYFIDCSKKERIPLSNLSKNWFFWGNYIREYPKNGTILFWRDNRRNRIDMQSTLLLTITSTQP